MVCATSLSVATSQDSCVRDGASLWCCQRAPLCPRCGRRLGDFFGILGFGIRLRGHDQRCSRRLKRQIQGEASCRVYALDDAPFVSEYKRMPLTPGNCSSPGLYAETEFASLVLDSPALYSSTPSSLASTPLTSAALRHLETFSNPAKSSGPDHVAGSRFQEPVLPRRYFKDFDSFSASGSDQASWEKSFQVLSQGSPLCAADSFFLGEDCLGRGVSEKDFLTQPSGGASRSGSTIVLRGVGY